MEARDEVPHDRGVDLLDLALPLLTRWRSLLMLPLGVGAVTLAATYLITPTFVAKTTLLPPQQSQSSALAALSSLGGLAGLAGGAAGLKNPSDQYVALMQSVSASDRIIEQFDLQRVYDAEYLELARRELARRVQISAGKKDGLLVVEVEDTDPKRAAAIANRYVEELRRMTSELAVTEAQQRRVFFEKQLLDTREKLAAAQTTLQRSGFNPGAIKAEPKAAAEAYARVQAELASAEVRLTTMRATLAEGNAQLRQQMATVQALRQQLQAIEQAHRAHDAGSGDADYVSAYREFKYQETLFDLMARQYELARVDESREGALVQVVDPALPPELKSKPKRGLLAVLATLVAGALYALWLVVRHQIALAARTPGHAARLSEIRQRLRGR